MRVDVNQFGTREESSVPVSLLIGSSRNSLKSDDGSGDSSCVPFSESEMFYRNQTDIIGRCAHGCDADSRLGETPRTPGAYSLILRDDDHFEFDGSLKQLYFRFDKLCRACGQTKLTEDFYQIRDYSKLGMTTYPAARCKPCHNERTAENQRERRAAQKIDRFPHPILSAARRGPGRKAPAPSRGTYEVTTA